jgi:hypothetical protein
MIWGPKAAGSDAPAAACALFVDRDDMLPRTIVAIVVCQKFSDRRSSRRSAASNARRKSRM